MALTKEEKAANALAVTTLKQAQDAEIIALKANLAAQGLKSSEVSKIISAEKKANSAELSAAKTAIKTSGALAAPRVSSATAYSGQTAFNVANTLTGAANLYSQYGISPVTAAESSQQYTGIPLSDLVKAQVNGTTAQGLFNKGSGSTALSNPTLKTLNSAATNYGSTISAEEAGKVKSIGTDAQGNSLFSSKISSGSQRTGYDVLKQNPDGSYTVVGVTASTVPPADDGGFFSSPIGKLALVGGAALTGGALSPFVASTLGTGAIASGAIAGGVIGAGTAALTGGNVFQGALLGGAGGALSGAFQAASGLTEAEFAAYDYQNLASQGLSPDQIAQTMSTSYNPGVVNAVTQAASTGVTNATELANLANQATGTTTSAGYRNAVFDDGSVLVTDASGRQIGFIDATGNAGGGLTQQVFDDGTRVFLDSNGQIVSGIDTSGGFFNGNNAISTAGTTDVVTGSANSYFGSNAPLGGTPQTNFGGNLANASDVSNLATGAGAAGLLSTLGGSGAIGDLLGSAVSGGAGLLGAQQDKKAKEAYAAALREAGDKSARQMQFQPIGMTTRFGSTTTPTYDENGRLTGFGYTAAPDIAAQRDRLLTLSNQALPETTDLTQATQNYYNQLQNLQNPQREQQLAGIMSGLQASGRGGLAFGATSGVGGANALAATNPELAAYYNALAQTQSQQALTAEQYAQQRLANQLSTSSNLFSQAGTLESAAQQPLNIGLNIGQTATTGSTNAARQQYQAAADAANLVASGQLAQNAAIQQGVAGLTNSGAVQGLLSKAGNYLGSLF